VRARISLSPIGVRGTATAIARVSLNRPGAAVELKVGQLDEGPARGEYHRVLPLLTPYKR
jgi:hypothetical protein